MENLENSEKEFIIKIAEGDVSAYTQFFNAYWKRIFANAQQFTKDPELAQDLAQEVFLKIWLKREQLYKVDNLEGYLYAIARNIFLDHLKKKVLDTSNSQYLETWFAETSQTIQQKLEFEELEALVQKAIAQLPPQMQTAFKLSRFEGLTHEEIASQMNISKVTSQSYIVRALTNIRKILSERKDILVAIFTLVLIEIKKNY